MSTSSKDAMDPVEQNRSDSDPPSSSSDTGTSLESSSDSSSSSSSSSESDTSTAESQSMTKEKLVKRIMKQLSISGSFSAESETSQDDDKSRGAGSKTSKKSKASKASSKKSAKMIDSILDDISLADSGSKAESRKEIEETEMEETEMEETEAEETEMEETEMEETEAEETNVEETEVEEDDEEDEDDRDEDDNDEEDAADGTEEAEEILPVIKGVLSDDTDPRVMRPPPIARRTKVIDEELETAAKVKRGETPKPPPPNPSPYYSYFPITFDNLFGCSVNKELTTAVDTPVTEDTKLNKAPSKESIKEIEAIPEMSARGKSTHGSERNHHAPIVIDEEDRISTSGSASQPLVDPSTLVSGRDSALLDMELNPVFAAVLPAASSGAGSNKSKTKGRKLVTTHSMPIEMNLSTDSGYAEKRMLRTIRSDDVIDAVTAKKTRNAAKRHVYKKGWSFSSTTKKKADDPSKVQTTSTLTPSDEPTKHTIANESVVAVDNETPDLTAPDHQSSPTTNDGELSSESDTSEEEDMTMESSLRQLNEAMDNTAGDTQVDGGRKVETQSTVRLSKKLKHWAVKKRGKQDNKNVEPASLEPVALASMYGVRPPTGKPKRRKKRKTKNLFRSIANYVRNQTPTLPVISEDPDHPDHHDHNDDSIAAPSAEAKVLEAMSHTSEQVVNSRSSHTDYDDMKDTSDNPVKREEGIVVSPQASIEPMEGIVVARSNSNSQGPADKRDDDCLSQKSSGRMVSKSRSTATADDANAITEETTLLHQQQTPSPENNKTFDSDQKSSIAATISSEVLNAKSTETKTREEAVGSNDDDDMESEMGLELTLSMPGGNVEETTNGAHGLSVDIATLNSNGSSSSDKEEPNEKASSPHKGEKNSQAFKNFFRLSISKPRSKKHIGEDEDGSQARLKTESREYNQPAASPQKALDRKSTWTELRSMSSVSASSPVGMKSLSSEDGAEDEKGRNSKTTTKRTSKVANKAMRKVLNLGKSRKNVEERSPVYEESRDTTTYDRDYENHRVPPPEAEADLSGPFPLRRWKSVELKIDESLKKVEALAANYGEDINALLLSESTSYGGDSSIGGGSSVGQSESSEWRDVEKKIDHSLSVAQRLASRLGVNASE